MVLYWVKGKRKQIDWLQETQEPKMDLNIGSKIVGFITLGCTVLGIASKKSNWHAPYSKKMNNFKSVA